MWFWFDSNFSSKIQNKYAFISLWVRTLSGGFHKIKPDLCLKGLFRTKAGWKGEMKLWCDFGTFSIRLSDRWGGKGGAHIGVLVTLWCFQQIYINSILYKYQIIKVLLFFHWIFVNYVTLILRLNITNVGTSFTFNSTYFQNKMKVGKKYCVKHFFHIDVNNYPTLLC